MISADDKHVLSDGESAYETAKRSALERIVAKRQGSRYVQRRSSDWLKIKTVQSQEDESLSVLRNAADQRACSMDRAGSRL